MGSERYIGGYAYVRTNLYGNDQYEYAHIYDIKVNDKLYISPNEYIVVTDIKESIFDYRSLAVLSWEKNPIFVSTWDQTRYNPPFEGPGISYEEYWKRTHMGNVKLVRLSTKQVVEIPVFNYKKKEVITIETIEKN